MNEVSLNKISFRSAAPASGVSPPEPPPPPPSEVVSITITAPGEGATVAGTIQVEGVASDV